MEIPQPMACEIYISSCGKIDQHNRVRQDDLGLEKKFGRLDWHKRRYQSFFGIIDVDTWQVYSKATETSESKNDFFCALAEELIDNTSDSRDRRVSTGFVSSSTSQSSLTSLSVSIRSGVGIHLTPSKRRRLAIMEFR